MAKTWVLDTETKGTGANVVPLEKALRKPEPDPAARPASAPKREPAAVSPPRKRRPPAGEPVRTSTALPPGHVRKKATGEIGKVLAVDARAGTATVSWLKRGATSTVPLTAISRR
jgi:hypothetical protein